LCHGISRLAHARSKEAGALSGAAKPHKGEKPQAKANKRLTEQIRKILGKHYASKYRVR
jgi:hypothetical protein